MTLKPFHLFIIGLSIPVFVVGAFAFGYQFHREPPPVDPRVVDEIRTQMATLRREIIIQVVNGVDIEDCRRKSWDIVGEFIPTVTVIGQDCKGGRKK